METHRVWEKRLQPDTVMSTHLHFSTSLSEWFPFGKPKCFTPLSTADTFWGICLETWGVRQEAANDQSPTSCQVSSFFCICSYVKLCISLSKYECAWGDNLFSHFSDIISFFSGFGFKRILIYITSIVLIAFIRPPAIKTPSIMKYFHPQSKFVFKLPVNSPPWQESDILKWIWKKNVHSNLKQHTETLREERKSSRLRCSHGYNVFCPGIKAKLWSVNLNTALYFSFFSILVKHSFENSSLITIKF